MSKQVQEGYNEWAYSYDTVENKTRDLDKLATQKVLSASNFSNVLELGCGTGKNTEWLAQKAAEVTAVDFSDQMLQQAQKKIKTENVQFVPANLLQPLPFENNTFDLVTCNLVLEHIQNLTPLFAEAARVLKPSGKMFVSELHPYKQYSGSKARFQKEEETKVLECHVHSISEFFNTALNSGFRCLQLDEWYDNNDTNHLPRLITFVFEKV